MKILVIYFDFFSKDLIKRLLENNIKAIVTKYDNSYKYLDKEFDVIIICGSKMRILRNNNLVILDKFIKKNSLIIGLCFGFQYLAYNTGGIIVEGNKYNGVDNININNHQYKLYFNHYDRVTHLSSKWKILIKKKIILY